MSPLKCQLSRPRGIFRSYLALHHLSIVFRVLVPDTISEVEPLMSQYSENHKVKLTFR